MDSKPMAADPAPQYEQPLAAEPAVAAAPAAAAAPQTTAHGDDDAADWINRIKAVAAKPEILTAPPPQGAVPWHNRMVEFFDPVDTCLVTWCCPCVTFGKTHHRLRKDANMVGYSPVNTSCLGWWVAACFGFHWLPQILQRHEIRTRNNLDGEIVTDCLRAWCCSCCDLVQQDKEAAYHALAQSEMVVNQQPTKQADNMAYPA